MDDVRSRELRRALRAANTGRGTVGDGDASAHVSEAAPSLQRGSGTNGEPSSHAYNSDNGAEQPVEQGTFVDGLASQSGRILDVESGNRARTVTAYPSFNNHVRSDVRPEFW